VGNLERLLGATGLNSVVPEPETYAMMVAGLGSSGLMLRRRGMLVRFRPNFGA
jgi:PEP-CTERM motif